MNAALKEQTEKLWHTTSIYHTEPIYEYAQALTATFPDPLKVGCPIETKLKIFLQSICYDSCKYEENFIILKNGTTFAS